MRFARYLEIALGVLFIVSAALKALDVVSFAVQVRMYNVVTDRMLVQIVAYTMIAIEALLGAALLGGYRFRGITFAATTALLLGFSGLIAYAWARHGLADCGCFGEYIKMGPASSIAKNLILLPITWIAWWGLCGKKAETPTETEGSLEPPRTIRRYPVMAIAGLVVVGMAFAFGKSPETINTVPAPPPPSGTQPVNSQPGAFAQFAPEQDGITFSLAEGEYLVAMLSASCDHCMDAVAVLNELAATPETPQIAALLMGNEDEVKEFMAKTGPAFPVQTIEVLHFMELIGSAPPRFYIVKDGKEVRHFDPMNPETREVLDVTFDQLLDFATKQ